MEEQYDILMRRIISFAIQVQCYQSQLDKNEAAIKTLSDITLNLLNKGYQKPQSQQYLHPGIVVQSEEFQATINLISNNILKLDRLREESEKLEIYKQFAEDQRQAYESELENL
ncbi:unnamed protein product [Orchesella dallaii]|uniref:Uncharacterized protein n=1 Tax=Orchesella dallaii TaxID=48710 RepID=A0ABP1PXK9_9HEXA